MSRLLPVGLLFGLLASSVTSGQHAPRLDTHGDPLPESAALRLGTERLRHGGLVYAAAASPDGKMLASAGQDNFIRLWDAVTGKETRRLAGHNNWVLTIAFSADGKLLVSGSRDSSVRIWDVATGKALRELLPKEADHEVHALALAPDGKLLASAAHNGGLRPPEVRLWDLVSGKFLRTIQVGERVQGMLFLPDGKTLATSVVGFRDSAIRFWEAETGKEVRTITPDREEGTGPLALSADGKLLACAGKQVTLWDPATGRQLRKLAGPKQGASAVAFSPRGQVLAVGGYRDSSIYLVDPMTGRELRRLVSHQLDITGLAFSPDGATVAAVGSFNNTVRVWEVGTGKEVASLPGRWDEVRTVAYAADGKMVATGGKEIRLWDAASGKEVRSLPGHYVVSALALSPDGKLLASAGMDQVDGKFSGSVRLWDSSSGKEVRQLPAGALALAFSADGKLLALAGTDKSITLLAPQTGKEVRRLQGHDAAVKAVAFSPDGKLLASGSADKSVRIWEVASGKEMHELRGQGAEVACVAYSPDGKFVASGGAQLFSANTIRLWDVAGGQEVHKLQGPQGQVASVAFSPDGKLLASVHKAGPVHVAGNRSTSTEKDGDFTVHLWDAATGQPLLKLPGHQGWVNAVVFAPDGQALVSVSADTSGLVWDLRPDSPLGKSLKRIRQQRQANAKPPEVIPVPRRVVAEKDSPVDLPLRLVHPDTVYGIDFSPEGKFLAAGNGDGNVYLWNLSTGKRAATLQGHVGKVWAVAYSPDGKTVASAGGQSATDGDFAVRLWDAASGKRTAKLEGHTHLVRSVAFSPDGKSLVTASYDHTVRLWDIVTGKETRKFTGHEYMGFAARVSPDGKRVASASNTAILWDLGSGQILHRFDGSAICVAFSPEGRTLATGGNQNDPLVRLWDVVSGKKLAQLEGHRSYVYAVAFSADGRFLASSDPNNTVFLWEMASRKLVRRWENKPGAIMTIAFSPDSRLLAWGGWDRAVQVGNLAPAHWDPNEARKPLGPVDLETYWADLKSDDAASAYFATWVLTAAGDKGVQFLKEQIRPVVADDVQVAKLIGQLESAQPAVRDRAFEELRNLGVLAEPALRQAVDKKPPLDLRRQLWTLLDGLEPAPLPPDHLRLVRAIAVLESVGNAEARQALERLAKGTPGLRPTTDAQAALTRLTAAGKR